MLGGLLVTLDLARLGWRAVFFVNVPFGAVIIAAASKIVPTAPRRAPTRGSTFGAIVLFAGLLYPDRPAAVRPRYELVIPGLAGDGRRGRDHRRLPAARTRGRTTRRHAADRAFAVVGAATMRGLIAMFFSSSPVCRSIWS